MPVEVNIQSVVDRYAKALEVPRLLFELYPNPRPQGAMPKQYRPLAAAICLSVIGTFEGFAEDLLAAALYKEGYGWAHIAQNADLTNPSVKALRDKLVHTVTIDPDPKGDWSTPLHQQTSLSGWYEKKVTWKELLTRAEGWIQVRHCLSHGLTTGLGPEVWPGPAHKKAANRLDTIAAAKDVLARTQSPNKNALQFWSAVECARIFSVGAAVIANAVADRFGEEISTTALQRFKDV